MSDDLQPISRILVRVLLDLCKNARSQGESGRTGVTGEEIGAPGENVEAAESALGLTVQRPVIRAVGIGEEE